ncbi:MAG TPA: isoprenylcysteine carboxylmethyltransferase family protein [Anaerolineales bacterium]
MAQIGLTQKAKIQMGLRAVLAPVALVVILFGLAGRWDYWQGWVYIVLNTLIAVIMATLLTPDRDLVEERLNPKQGVKSWDRVYFALSTPLYFVGVGVAGLDARFHWTSAVPAVVYWVAVLVYLIGNAIMQWARYTNRFFSSMVRIQTDRGQTVCKSGPYRYVRHPGYVGGILFECVTGIVLGSWWACIPQVLAAALLVWRTSLEDKTLQAELPGYADFARATRYRLLPGLW